MRLLRAHRKNKIYGLILAFRFGCVFTLLNVMSQNKPKTDRSNLSFSFTVLFQVFNTNSLMTPKSFRPESSSLKSMLPDLIGKRVKIVDFFFRTFEITIS